jgi:hypothetical protein
MTIVVPVAAEAAVVVIIWIYLPHGEEYHEKFVIQNPRMK